jgi:3-dehydrosphinganine reductase
MKSFAGRHAVITGGSSGIGLATAHALGRRGCRVTIVARRPELLEAAVAELTASGVDADSASLDVADRQAVEAVFAGITAERGPIDILICSAGVARPGYFSELDDDVFREMMEVDYFGTLWPIRAVTPAMVERGEGSIVGISSDVGLVGVFGYTAYAAAKFAVRGLLESLRAELAPSGVHVGCCYPPDVDTPQLAWEDQYKPDETRAISASFKPLRPEKVADCIVKGIERRRFALMPDAGSRMLLVLSGAAPGLVTRVMDRSAGKARKAHPGDAHPT